MGDWGYRGSTSIAELSSSFAIFPHFTHEYFRRATLTGLFRSEIFIIGAYIIHIAYLSLPETEVHTAGASSAILDKAGAAVEQYVKERSCEVEYERDDFFQNGLM